MENDLKFSVCMPTYRMGRLIDGTIQDILSQSFSNFELIITDNDSQDETESVVARFKDKRIMYFKNEVNLGYFKNLNACFQKASGDIIYLMSAKSRLSKDALLNTYRAFKVSNDIGAVTRPYYWYGYDVSIPLRAKRRYAKDRDLVVSIHDDIEKIIAVFETLDNPAGLAYRRKYMDVLFHGDPFVEFTYPFASIMKRHKVVLLKDYTMACPGLEYSGSQNPCVYEKSPMQNWVDLFNNIFPEDEFRSIREKCIKDFVAVNYIGLVQIRNYARHYGYLLREIFLLAKYRRKNLLNLKFWFFSLGTAVMPRCVLIPFVSWYKKVVNANLLRSLEAGGDICLKM